MPSMEEAGIFPEHQALEEAAVIVAVILRRLHEADVRVGEGRRHAAQPVGRRRYSRCRCTPMISASGAVSRRAKFSAPALKPWPFAEVEEAEFRARGARNARPPAPTYAGPWCCCRSPALRNRRSPGAASASSVWRTICGGSLQIGRWMRDFRQHGAVQARASARNGACCTRPKMVSDQVETVGDQQEQQQALAQRQRAPDRGGDRARDRSRPWSSAAWRARRQNLRPGRRRAACRASGCPAGGRAAAMVAAKASSDAAQRVEDPVRVVLHRRRSATISAWRSSVNMPQ